MAVNTQVFVQAVNQVGNPAQVQVWAALANDLAAIKASINGITAKLDADAGVTDTNYTSLWAVGTLNTVK